MGAPELISPTTSSGGAPVGGSGIPGTIAKFGTSTTVTNSVIVESGGNIGIGVTPTTEKVAVGAGGNDRIGLNVSGTVSTLTFGSSNPASGGYRTISYDRTAATWTFNYGTNPAAASPSFTIDNTGRILIAQNGTASLPILANSTGVSGMYFPSASTAAIVANGAIAATFNATAGNGVALGGTTGLIFNASGTQQGVRFAATPDNTNANTIDCYVDGGASAGGVSWTPTLSAAATWGGTAPTVTNARYTRIGNMVFCTVTLDNTGGVAFSSTYGSSTITTPAGISAAVFTSVPSNRGGTSANGAQSGTTIFVPTYASSVNVINITWFYAV